VINEIDEQLQRLRKIFTGMRSCLIAYSGGVDSALVLAVAHQALGERALGCIGVSPSYPQRERRAAIQLAESIGASYRIVSPQEQLDNRYNRNEADRCYFCRTALFENLQNIARREGWHAIADGIHLDDVSDHAHGMRAAAARRVRSPLMELSLNKSDVRALARALELPVWNKPAMACLASRVPHGTRITSELLEQIEQAEDVLAAAGFHQFRVRHHGDLARIELASEELNHALEQRQEIVEGVRRAGYRHVTLDLLGYHESAEPLIQLHVASSDTR
jgi:uncharacterized protein